MLHVVFITTPPDQAERIARTLVEERLAACVNLLPGVKSVYHWQGQVETGDESLLVLKVPGANLDALYARVPEIHPYQVPEIIALPVASGLPAYLAWAEQEARPS
jgi:periplasmic divalent cation tolerance protein